MNNSPRFEVRFSNGYYKTFDTLTYSSKGIHTLLKDALEYTAFRNNQVR